MDFELLVSFLAMITVDHFPLYAPIVNLIARVLAKQFHVVIASVPPPRHQHQRCFHHTCYYAFAIIHLGISDKP